MLLGFGSNNHKKSGGFQSLVLVLAAAGGHLKGVWSLTGQVPDDWRETTNNPTFPKLVTCQLPVIGAWSINQYDFIKLFDDSERRNCPGNYCIMDSVTSGRIELGYNMPYADDEKKKIRAYHFPMARAFVVATNLNVGGNPVDCTIHR